ncbi:MAG TPA: AmmeMemoRadiSam system protein B, partial [Roseiflexaceae bacterium]|nr:AmmeMemoRadiSam system protein B [Roseiflexaceae bacterium]
LDEQREQALRDDDAALLRAMASGRAHEFLAEVRRQADRNNVCGVPPTYLALDILGATQGELIGYARCPADDNNTSAVTVAGMVFV